MTNKHLIITVPRLTFGRIPAWGLFSSYAKEQSSQLLRMFPSKTPDLDSCFSFGLMRMLGLWCGFTGVYWGNISAKDLSPWSAWKLRRFSTSFIKMTGLVGMFCWCFCLEFCRQVCRLLFCLISLQSTLLSIHFVVYYDYMLSHFDSVVR